MDLFKNWRSYQECDKPINVWLLVSMCTIIVMRSYQIIAFSLSYNEVKERLSTRINLTPTTTISEISIINLNWHLIPALKKWSYF